MTTLIALLVTLGVLIVVHEWGHYAAARACGVKVLRFSIGFGPVLWRRRARSNGTEFVVAALPLGGYVRMLDSREDGCNPQEIGQAFDLQPLRRRTLIVAAGPIANLALAVLLYAVSHWIGIREPGAVVSEPLAGSVAAGAGFAAGDRVLEVSSDGQNWESVTAVSDFTRFIDDAHDDGTDVLVRVSGRGERGIRELHLRASGESAQGEQAFDALRRIGFEGLYAEPVLTRVNEGGAAWDAGLREGDRVLSVDGLAVADAASLRRAIRATLGADGAVRPMRWDVVRVDAQGQERLFEARVMARVIQDKGQGVARVEAFIGSPPAMVEHRYGLIDGLSQAVSRTADGAWLTLTTLGRILTGQASLSQISGPVTMADYAGQTADLGWVYFLSFLAWVSIGLGVMNLLPLPVLDGGHLMYYLFEAVTGRPVSDVWLQRLQKAGLAFLFLLMSLALYNDMARLLGQP
jgi:regulator of sigma E protease